MGDNSPFLVPAGRLWLLLLPFMAWTGAGLLLMSPPGAYAADVPDASSLCATKCGTCPVVCATPPPPSQSYAICQMTPPPPPKKSDQSPPAVRPPPAGVQQGLATPYYYFYTASAVRPSPEVARGLLLLLFSVVAVRLR